MDCTFRDLSKRGIKRLGAGFSSWRRSPARVVALLYGDGQNRTRPRHLHGGNESCRRASRWSQTLRLLEELATEDGRYLIPTERRVLTEQGRGFMERRQFARSNFVAVAAIATEEGCRAGYEERLVQRFRWSSSYIPAPTYVSSKGMSSRNLKLLSRAWALCRADRTFQAGRTYAIRRMD